jgi:hypothetical protein
VTWLSAAARLYEQILVLVLFCAWAPASQELMQGQIQAAGPVFLLVGRLVRKTGSRNEKYWNCRGDNTGMRGVRFIRLYPVRVSTVCSKAANAHQCLPNASHSANKGPQLQSCRHHPTGLEDCESAAASCRHVLGEATTWSRGSTLSLLIQVSRCTTCALLQRPASRVCSWRSDTARPDLLLT